MSLMKPSMVPKRLHFWPYFMTILLVALATAVAEFFYVLFPSRDLIMFYLLAVVVISLRWGSGPAILGSFLSVLVFDYCFVPPRFGFIAIHNQDWIALAAFLIVGLSISALTAREHENSRKIQAIEILREKEKFQSVLLHSVSHDLRTPLASITATLSNLFYNKGLDNETREELVAAAYGESARLNQLVGNLLDMTKVEAGALKVSLKPCDIRDLAGAALGQFPKERLERRSVRAGIADLPEVCLDFTLMMKVLVNLVDNALKYSPEDSPVEIEGEIREGKLFIEVLDYGHGIPEKELPHIFEKFYRGEHPDTPGTGLGLAICKGIVEAHNGKIWAENRGAKRGTKMVIQLPLNTRLDNIYG